MSDPRDWEQDGQLIDVLGSTLLSDVAGEIEPRQLPPRPFPFGFTPPNVSPPGLPMRSRHRDTARPA